MTTTTTMHARNVFIVEFLRQHSEDERRTIREIWEAATRPTDEAGLGDEASLPTYHRTVAILVREGQLDEAGTNRDGAMLYRVSAQLSALSTFTQTDLNAALWEMSPPDAMATYLDAVDYFESRSDDVLRKAARLLVNEDPRDLILRMLKDQADALVDDAEIFRDPKAVDPAHLAEANRKLRRLHQLVNGELGISASVWSFPSFEGLQQGDSFQLPDWGKVRDALDRSVFGDHFIEKVTARGDGRPDDVVAGSDGSTHAGYVRGVRAPQYVEEEGRLVLTFNNSLAYVDLPKNHPSRVASPYHSIPLTRAALEDPQNRGMILSRPWFNDLSDSEYEHTKKAALDVVQFRVDERLMTGTARALGTTQATSDSGRLPRPNVLIRDGTVTPQEREFQHYLARNSYGDIVREGITLSYKILGEVRDSNRRVFAGAVKFTVLRTFSTILNWFIKKHVEPNWDMTRASVVSDPVAMTRLFKALPSLSGTDYYRTCVIVRPFPAMVVDLRSVKAESPAEWLDYFKKRRARQQADADESGGTTTPWMSDLDVEDDHYVRLCQHADYASFFFGRPGGDPQITVPRFEFMDSLREKTVPERRARVSQACESIVAAVHHTKWAMDREHNFMSGRKLPRMVPYVVYEAHEKCKALGHKLESELRQAIAARLSQLKASRGAGAPSKVDIEPMSINKYVEKMRRLLGPPDESGGTP